jgi:hypothetical protein
MGITRFPIRPGVDLKNINSASPRCQIGHAVSNPRPDAEAWWHPFPIKQRPDIRAPVAANLTDEQRLKIRQPDVVQPPVHRDRMGAFVIAAIDKQVAETCRAHFAEAGSICLPPRGRTL